MSDRWGRSAPEGGRSAHRWCTSGTADGHHSPKSRKTRYRLSGGAIPGTVVRSRPSTGEYYDLGVMVPGRWRIAYAAGTEQLLASTLCLRPARLPTRRIARMSPERSSSIRWDRPAAIATSSSSRSRCHGPAISPSIATWPPPSRRSPRLGFGCRPSCRRVTARRAHGESYISGDPPARFAPMDAPSISSPNRS